ncbi:MAG TPA: hypothetical protein PK054_07325 [Anaerohalosphaeraceae bacterium]|nr:hypothetical protein [Anaerohalosphaeraceae bacterium]HOL88569.1 hypothetical protein [Anaerohalosphaeraceae bacterium]HPP56377.1 hypothetical protein [Anaerohalosphaeraceae bacterium]
MKSNEHMLTLEPLLRVFEMLGISYYIGGSLASSAYGIARATLDIGLVADIRMHQVEPLAAALKPFFYISPQTAEQAIARQTSLNLIHLQTMLKVDIFVLRNEPFDWTAFQRRRQDTFSEEQPRPIYLATAEDVILSKLRWYRQGGCTSDQQWKDILGVLKVQTLNLDIPYLKKWSAQLGVLDLFEQSLQQAGIQPTF